MGYWTENGSIWIDYLPQSSPGFTPQVNQLGMCNYISNCGYDGMTGSANQLAGPYYTNSQTTLVGITDGTSNTVGFGETLSSEVIGARHFVMAWMGSGTEWAAYGNPSDQNAHWYTWGSRHPMINNFSFCDGSVRPITKGCDYNTFIYACGMQDGVAYNPSNLGQ